MRMIMSMRKACCLYSLIVTIFALTFATSTKARQPAVDPVQGISIDEYKDVPPEKNKGSYEFSERPTPQNKRETVTQGAKPKNPGQSVQKEIQNRQVASPTQKTDWPLGFLLVALLALPFAIWWIFQKNLKNHQTPPPHTDNTVDLREHRNRKGDSQDDDYPKAS